MGKKSKEKRGGQPRRKGGKGEKMGAGGKGAVGHSPAQRAGPGSAGRRAPCAGSIGSGPWSCATHFRAAGRRWDTGPGYPPGQAGRTQPPGPRSLDHQPPPGWALTSSTIWGPRAPGRPCRRLSTARFTFSAQRGSARLGQRRTTRPARRMKPSGTRPRAALGRWGGDQKAPTPTPAKAPGHLFTARATAA